MPLLVLLLIPIPTSEARCLPPPPGILSYQYPMDDGCMAINIRTIDESGNNLDYISIDQKIYITTDIANGQHKIQPYVFIVQITNSAGEIISIKSFAGMLSSGQSWSPSIPFTLKEPGKYTATTFVWESFQSLVVLTRTSATTITVIPDNGIILYVDSKLVDCVGVGPQQCMQIRENHYSQWELFYGSIEGFAYQEGKYYELIVEVTKVDNPPADSSSLKYKLIRILFESK